VGGWAIVLMCSLLTVVARAGRSPAMAGDEAVTARPSRLGLRGNAGDARPSRAPGGSREELWVTGFPRARAEQGVHRRC
jgi:hypothetical protein